MIDKNKKLIQSFLEVTIINIIVAFLIYFSVAFIGSFYEFELNMFSLSYWPDLIRSFVSFFWFVQIVFQVMLIYYAIKYYTKGGDI